MTAIGLRLRETRRNHTTGKDVGLYDGIASAMDTASGRWQTVCEAHGTVTSHSTLALARAWMSRPDEWCEVCMEERMR